MSNRIQGAMLETRQREQVDAADYEKYQGDQRLTFQD